MQTSFDLISDLHIETWDQQPDWKSLATSMYCVVAGDVARDRGLVIETLAHLSNCYKAVLYIDGNDEHRYHYDRLPESLTDLYEQVKCLENVIPLQDNVAVIDGVAFVGVNGWWTYDFDDAETYTQSKRWIADQYDLQHEAINQIEAMALLDTKYLNNTVDRLQKHKDIETIVIVSHTVPSLDLVAHDLDLENTHRLNCLGNRYIRNVLQKDTEGKITTWCFGHYHKDIERVLDGVKYINNCRGRANTEWSKTVYFPKKIYV